MRRPRITYSDAVARRILDQLARGRTLQQICSAADMPNICTVFAWVRGNRDGFADRYRKVRHPRGQASRYTRALADRVCDGLRTGRTLRDICAARGMPSVGMVRHWMATDRDGFRARCWQARAVGYLAIADEIIDIADNTVGDGVAPEGEATAPRRRHAESVEQARLRITARCWLLSRMLPRAFGAGLSVEAMQDAGPSLREVLAIIDGRSRGLPSADGAAQGQGAGARRCPNCGEALAPP